MPMPAVPEPWTTTRCSASGMPTVAAADRIAARATAPVPCMSSLKVSVVARYRSRIRRALLVPKSSQCRIAFGKIRVAACT